METTRKRKHSETDFGKGKSKFSNKKTLPSNKRPKGIALANQYRRMQLNQPMKT